MHPLSTEGAILIWVSRKIKLKVIVLVLSGKLMKSMNLFILYLQRQAYHVQMRDLFYFS